MVGGMLVTFSEYFIRALLSAPKGVWCSMLQCVSFSVLVGHGQVPLLVPCLGGTSSLGGNAMLVLWTALASNFGSMFYELVGGS